MTARETLVTTLTNLLAVSRRGRMDAHRAEAERLVDEVLHEAAEVIRAWERGAVSLLPLERGAAKGAANLIDPAADFDALLRASEQRAEAKREARVYPYDLEVG